MAAEPGAFGHLIAITGIPSVGKSTVSRAVQSRSSTFQYFDGDQFIRSTPQGLQLVNALRTFVRMLDEVEEGMAAGNVILDVTLPGSFVERTREQFGSRVMLVSLRIDEGEWRRRDSKRADRGRLKHWDASLTALQGPEHLYDVVIDTTHMSPDRCAETILSGAQGLWGGVRI